MLTGQGFETIRIQTEGAAIHCTHGGSGAPLLLLHGYPQTHVMWHQVIPALVDRFHVICPDLRGYGDSATPPSTADHAPYSKRAMAQDMVEVMAALGYATFGVAGHDRGARVTHRLALDYPHAVQRACVMDIVPTDHMFQTTDQAFATGYYHWFFLIQPGGLPERMIGADPAYYLTEKLQRWSAPGTVLSQVFGEEAIAEYIRCFGNPAVIHATCEDYRAAATIDLVHDAQDRHKTVACPLLVLWGGRGFVQRTYDVLGVWRDRADQVQGKALDCGHFLAEEAPDAVAAELLRFFAD
ncbi:MAG TPA: alpha/beta hydrolase [Chroococcidiopsis sp.]